MAQPNDHNPKAHANRFKPVVLVFLVFFVAGLVISGVACAVFFVNNQADIRDVTIATESTDLKIYHQFINQTFINIISDLLVMADQYGKTPSMENSCQNKWLDDYTGWLRVKSHYDQIRYLNSAGYEVVRVNYNNGAPYTVPVDALQSKKGRYYFREAASLPPNTIYISKLDLNVENGQVERPYKPVIRFCIPQHDESKQFLGMYVINFMGERLLDEVEKTASLSTTRLNIVNAQGYWLHSDNAEEEWGFMFPERAGSRFDLRFPDAWSKISSAKSGQIETSNGLFTFITVTPEELNSEVGLNVSIHHRDPWKIISHITPTELYSQSNHLRRTLILLWSAMSVASALPSWLLANALVRKREQQRQLLYTANYDTLTGLANRPSFIQMLQHTLEDGKRYQRNFAVFFVDLDGFKKINDTLGHDAGDQLLGSVARRLQECLRSADIVARLGGDEFCIIAKEINSLEDGNRIAAKILDALNRPFRLKRTLGNIGASIGMALFPYHGDSADVLIKLADDAMYMAKNSGKNRYFWACDLESGDE